jgi:hypothetical protein
MVRIILLCALAAFSLSPVHGINLDVTSVGESPLSLWKTHADLEKTRSNQQHRPSQVNW